MTSPTPVSSSTVLRAVLEVQRRGNAAVLEELEGVEPKLGEFLMESLSMVHQHILSLGGPAKRSRCAYRQIESLTLVCILTLRHHHTASDGDDGDDPSDPSED